jgi:hypothetical protein
VYSYSKRSTDNNVAKNSSSQEEMNKESKTTGNEAIPEETKSEKVATETNKEETIAKSESTKQPQEDRASSIATSQETEESFIETAGKGDGLTHLARRALANYLEKNPDSSLTPEHKIYIEDYLRKNIENQNRVKVGTSIEFSKKLIQEAIGKSKNLNEKQLQNLHKYAVRVPSLS